MNEPVPARSCGLLPSNPASVTTPPPVNQVVLQVDVAAVDHQPALAHVARVGVQGLRVAAVQGGLHDDAPPDPRLPAGTLLPRLGRAAGLRQRVPGTRACDDQCVVPAGEQRFERAELNERIDALEGNGVERRPPVPRPGLRMTRLGGPRAAGPVDRTGSCFVRGIREVVEQDTHAHMMSARAASSSLKLATGDAASWGGGLTATAEGRPSRVTP